MKTKQKHIVFFRNPEEEPCWGGLEKLMMDWFEHIDYTQCKVTLAISPHWRNNFNDKFIKNGLPVNVIELPLESKKILSLGRFLKINRFIKQLGPTSVVFVQGWFFSFDIVYVFAAWLHTRQVFMHENLGCPETPKKEGNPNLGFIPRLALWWHVDMFKIKLRAYLSKNIIVVSKELKERVVSCWQYPSNKVLIKYHGIDLKKYYPSAQCKAEMHQTLGIAQEETVIITAARLTKVKRIDRAIEAFSLLHHQYPNTSLIILGSGELENDLKKQAQTLPCNHKIKFIGHVDNVADHLKMGDVYLLSSDNEGFGISLIEAMACGLICVATKCPGPNEIIQNGINGFLVEKNTLSVLKGFKTAIELSTDEKNKIRKNAMAFVVEHCNINAQIADIFKTFKIAYS